MVTVAIVAILATMVLPLTQLAVQRSKEAELRANLREIRAAIDAYKAASDEGRIIRTVDGAGYPPSLHVMVTGVQDAKDPTGSKIRFLRRLPRDPFADARLHPAQTWGLRCYASEADQPQEGVDVYDVYSLHPGVGLNGIPYRDW